MIDWGEAGRVAGIGFGVVFFVLIVLWLVIKATGSVLLGVRNKSKDKKLNQEQDKK